MRSSQLPAGQKTVELIGDNLIVDGPVDLDLVRVTNPGPDRDALSLASRATGIIRRVELETNTEDGIKVQNSDQNAAHDLEILGGFVKGTGASGGAHADGIQVMGGARLTFRNLDIWGFTTQGIFVNTGGGGATVPTDIQFIDCDLPVFADWTDGPATPININASLRTVVRGCRVCRSERFGRGIVVGSAAIDELLENNTEFAVGECPDFEDPSPPTDSLPLRALPAGDGFKRVAWDPVPGAIGYRISNSTGEGKFSHTWDPEFQRDDEFPACNTRYPASAAWVKVEALMPGPFGDLP